MCIGPCAMVRRDAPRRSTHCASSRGPKPGRWGRRDSMVWIAPAMTELIQQFREDRVLAWRKGTPFTQSEFLSDVMAMAESLPDAEFVVNLCDDRYNFLVAFGAALAREQVSLLPHSRVPGVLEQIRSSYPGAY